MRRIQPSSQKLKGQASGPIELVIAVIILVASMGLAFSVLQSTQSAQCVDKLKSQMRGLESVMLDVALGSPSTSRETDLEMLTCGGTSIEAIRVVYYDTLSYCGKCPATGGGCWVVEPLAYDLSSRQYVKISEATTCINMPGRVLLESDDQCAETGLISTNDGCPPNAKETREGCGLPPSIYQGTDVTSASSRLLTMGKTAGETQYKARITKEFATSSGDPVLKVCFLTKAKAREQR